MIHDLENIDNNFPFYVLFSKSYIQHGANNGRTLVIEQKHSFEPI